MTTDPNRPDPNRPDPNRPDPNRPDPNRSDPERPEPIRSDPGHPDPKRPDPGRHDPTRRDPDGVAELVATTVASPIGELTVVASARGIRRILWPGDALPAGVRTVDVAGAPGGADEGSVGHLRRAATQLGEYFDGERREFDLELDPVGTEFQLAAWEALRRIEYAATTTYGEQAAGLGSPTAARAVGAANGRNPIPIVVPCHRVVGRDGSLTGFAGGLDAKRRLLELERRVAGATLL